MKFVKYDFGFMFTYSERPGTLAGNKMDDDVPHEIKKRRLTRNYRFTTRTRVYTEHSNI